MALPALGWNTSAPCLPFVDLLALTRVQAPTPWACHLPLHPAADAALLNLLSPKSASPSAGSLVPSSVGDASAADFLRLPSPNHAHEAAADHARGHVYPVGRTFCACTSCARANPPARSQAGAGARIGAASSAFKSLSVGESVSQRATSETDAPPETELAPKPAAEQPRKIRRARSSRRVGSCTAVLFARRAVQRITTRRQYVCPLCKKAFSQKSNLLQHEVRLPAVARSAASDIFEFANTS
jgi:hypothetical protein